MLKYFALIYPLGASVLKHLIILECPTSGHLTQYLNFLVTIPPPPREHSWAFDLTGYDSANARVPGHN
jgi:hypothetical protein